jgi:hypothetical protein
MADDISPLRGPITGQNRWGNSFSKTIFPNLYRLKTYYKGESEGIFSVFGCNQFYIHLQKNNQPTSKNALIKYIFCCEVNQKVSGKTKVHNK